MRLVRILAVSSLAAVVLALAAAPAGAQELLVTGLALLATGAAVLALARHTRTA